MIWYGENSETQQILGQSEEDELRTKANFVDLRFLLPEDISEVKTLCEESFPIQYPQKWYEDITQNSSKFYSLAATYNSAIVGLLVAEIKNWHKLNKEDRTILSENLGKNSSLAYILSIGVHRKYRRNGIATRLLQTFIEHLQNSEQNSTIKAIYLHVLTTNNDAISFYERHNFQLHSFLPYYYSIKGQSKDGYCFVSYINGGTQPSTFIERVRNSIYNIFKLNFCNWIMVQGRTLVNWLSYHTFAKIHYFRQ